MVIADNDTRWNSTYLSIIRGLKLRTKITAYSINNRDELDADFLEESDWKVLQDVADCLEPFCHGTDTNAIKDPHTTKPAINNY